MAESPISLGTALRRMLATLGAQLRHSPERIAADDADLLAAEKIAEEERRQERHDGSQFGLGA